MLTTYPTMRPCWTSSNVPGVSPTTWRWVCSGSIPALASMSETTLSLVPPSDGTPIVWPTKSLGCSSGCFDLL